MLHHSTISTAIYLLTSFPPTFRLIFSVYYSDTVLTTEVVNIQLNIGYWTTDQYTVDQVEVFIIKNQN